MNNAFKSCSVRKYWFKYKWKIVFEMIKNMSKKPNMCDEPFDRKTVVITGATSGIGYETAKKYASMGARIISVNRNKEKSEKLCYELKEKYETECDYILADLSKIADIRKVGYELSTLDEKIDVLIHNAGLYTNKRTITDDGLELNFVVHYLAPFLINQMILEKLKKDKNSRIIFVSSEAYRFAAWGICLDDLLWEKHKYSGLKAYGSAKLAQILSMHIFSEIVKDYGITVNAMHPGFVKTNTGSENGPIYKFFKKNILDKLSQEPTISAEALYYLGASKDLDGITDKFFHLTTIEELTSPAKDLELAKALWNKTGQIIRSLGIDMGVRV